MSENARRPQGGPHGHGPRVAEKPENFGRAIGKLLRFLKPFYPAIIVALVFAALATVCSVVGPSLIQELTNTIQDSFMLDGRLAEGLVLDMERVLFYCFLLVGIYAASLVCSFIQNWLMAGRDAEKFAQHAPRRLRKDQRPAAEILRFAHGGGYALPRHQRRGHHRADAQPVRLPPSSRRRSCSSAASS